MTAEIHAAEDRSNDRHDDVAGQASGDGSECGADDDGDRQVKHISFGDEGLKFRKHGIPPTLLWVPRILCRFPDN